MRRESRSTKNRKTQKETETELTMGGWGGLLWTIDCGPTIDFEVVEEKS